VAFPPAEYDYYEEFHHPVVLDGDPAAAAEWMQDMPSRASLLEQREQQQSILSLEADAVPDTVASVVDDSQSNHTPDDTSTSSISRIDNLLGRNSSSNTTLLPAWLQEYFGWHHQKRAQLTAENWKEHKYLIMSCLKGHKCGGVTDRLRPLPALLRAAYNTRRLLLIYWEQPFALEELLVPSGRFDWCVPDYMTEDLQHTTPTGHWRSIINSHDPAVMLSSNYQVGLV
jgi:hypothetical protein